MNNKDQLGLTVLKAVQRLCECVGGGGLWVCRCHERNALRGITAWLPCKEGVGQAAPAGKVELLKNGNAGFLLMLCLAAAWAQLPPPGMSVEFVYG